MPGSQKPWRRPGCVILIVLCIALLVYVPIELYRSQNVIETELITLSAANIPAGFDGYCIVLLSDMHQKPYGRKHEQLVDKIRAQSPDLIAITGDMFQNEEGFAYVESVCTELVTIAPVYYVTGNHEWTLEWKADVTDDERMSVRLRAIFDRLGVVWLDSQLITLERGGDRIVLAGISDPNGYSDAPNVQSMSVRTRNQYPELFSIALSHRYDMIKDYQAADFDVVLTGHGHGGLVRLPFTDGLIGADRAFFPQYTSGDYVFEGFHMVVSRGLGPSYMPRFFNRPHLPVITLRAAQGA